MYSYEERIRAVKRYIKVGKRTGASIRDAGVPDQERAQELASRNSNKAAICRRNMRVRGQSIQMSRKKWPPNTT